MCRQLLDRPGADGETKIGESIERCMETRLRARITEERQLRCKYDASEGESKKLVGKSLDRDGEMDEREKIPKQEKSARNRERE